MSKFMLLIRNEGNPMANVTDSEREAVMQKWGAYMGGLGKQLIDGLPFGSEGHVVTGAHVSNDRHNEGATNVGGYLILDAANMNEAVELSKSCPALDNPTSSIEVRECMSM